MRNGAEATDSAIRLTGHTLMFTKSLRRWFEGNPIALLLRAETERNRRQIVDEFNHRLFMSLTISPRRLCVADEETSLHGRTDESPAVF